MTMHRPAGGGWRPRRPIDWTLTIVAWLLALLAIAMAFYMLNPIDYDGLGRLGWFGFLFPLQLLIATVASAAVGGIAWRRRVLTAAGGFFVVSLVTLGLALWPSVVIWRQASRYHVSLSIREALEPSLESNGSGRGQSVVYATAPDGEKLLLDVWREHGADSSSEAREPAIVKVHGGAWIRGSRSGHADWNRWLNRLGFDVFDVEYELPPRVHWQGEVGDVKCALGWVAAHAASYHVDPARISVMGYSAGGNLAMLAAYSRGDARLPSACDASTVAVRSVVNLYGPSDLPLLYRTTGSGAYLDRALQQYVGGSPSEFPDRYRILSPVSHVNAQTPPTITLLGESDRLIPASQASVLDKALAQAGVAHATYLLPATDHGFDVDWHGFATQIARVAIEQFLARYG